MWEVEIHYWEVEGCHSNQSLNAIKLEWTMTDTFQGKT